MFFDFHPDPWGRWSNLTHIFSIGLVQPPTSHAFSGELVSFIFWTYKVYQSFKVPFQTSFGMVFFLSNLFCWDVLSSNLFCKDVFFFPITLGGRVFNSRLNSCRMPSCKNQTRTTFFLGQNAKSLQFVLIFQRVPVIPHSISCFKILDNTILFMWVSLELD